MSSRRLLVLCVLVVGFLAVPTTVALAQDDVTANQKQAMQHDEAARTAFRLGEFDKAITEWKEAYRLASHPVFLYNIAQAYRRKEVLDQSIFFYKQYLQEAPDAGNRAEVEKRIEELETLIEKNKQASTAPPDDPLHAGGESGGGGTTTGGGDTTTGGGDTTAGGDTTSPADTAVPDTGTDPLPGGETGPTDTGDRPGRTMKLTGLGVGGAGVALLGTGIVFALKASSAQSDVEDAVANNEPWTDELQDKHDSGESSATIAKVTIGLGIVAIAGGATLYFLGRRDANRAEEGVSVLPVVGPDGAGIALELRY